ncbi:MAG: sigma-54 dependent transcriptional regulator [Nitrospiria bacterium]
MKKILVVEDHDSLRAGIVETFERSGHRVVSAPDAETAIRLIGEEFFATVITDMSLPGKSGLDILKAAKATNPLTAVIVMTAYGTVENAVEAMRLGAEDYIQKPFQIEELELKVSKSLEHQTIQQNLNDLRGRFDTEHHLLGESPALKALITLIHKVAHSSSTILIEGETGTGKELVANAIHAASPRASRSLIKVNCAALPEHLLESELFGHERGAFTGADRQRIGRFELAHSGSLFLDEVAEISPATQAKLLRVVQEQAFERVGGEKTISVDVRLIVATNKNLKTEVREHRFREDLFYRLNVITITLPPLRERREDIPLLAQNFLQRYARELGKPLAHIEPNVMAMLQDHHWPGNIRELENAIERAVLMAEGEVIQPGDLGTTLHPNPPQTSTPQPHSGPPPTTPALKRLDHVEKNTILEALAQTHWIQKDAARLLGISPRVLNYKIKTYGITHSSWLKHRPPGQAAA